jgi:hypothetical protein
MVPILAANGKTRKSDIENFLKLKEATKFYLECSRNASDVEGAEPIYYPHNKLGKGYLARTGEGVK